ncbi:hypothetical protein MK489_14355 [Myxococcota bacterium]|nr:hypothetical protein [Myxococcota bacterium]
MKNLLIQFLCKPTALALAMLLGFTVTFINSSPADAALKKYEQRRSNVLQFLTTSPRAEYRSVPSRGKAIIDDDGTGSPVLKKMLEGTGRAYGVAPQSSTTLVPSLSAGFIFVKLTYVRGPAGGTVGSGSTSSEIDWATTSGWTVTGGDWCNANPPYICDLARREYQETVSGVLNSLNFDIGTWIFHGTGYTSDTGFILLTSPTSLGNMVQWTRGSLSQDGTVPALPLLGVGTIAVSVVAMGIASVRRRNRP